MEPTIIEGYRLSPQQRRLWHVQQDRGVLFAQLALRIEGELDPQHLTQALGALIARHEILRTAYRRTAGVPFPVQVILETATPVTEEVDLRDLEAEARRARAAELMAGHRRREVDLEAAPVLLASLVRLAEDRHLLLLSLPSLSADARTLSNLAEQLAANYEACRSGGHDLATDEDLIQYLQFSEWQLQLLDDDEAASPVTVWDDISAGAPTLPFYKEPGSEPRSWEKAAVAVAFTPEQAAAASALASARNLSVFAVLLAAWQTLLARLTETREIVVAVPFDGRKYSELSTCFGHLGKWLPVRLKVDPQRPFEEVLAYLQGALEEAESWQEYYTPPDGVIASTGFLFRQWPAARAAGGATFVVEELRVEDEPIPLTLFCLSRPEGLKLSLLYAPDAFSPEAVAYLGARLEALLADALAHPERVLGELDFLGPAERRRLLGEASQGPSKAGGDEPIHRTIAAQAARAPEAPAVVCGERVLTYAELDGQANQLAHRLRRQGVSAGSLVALWLPRSPELVVTLLGVLKAGAAYVPLDPAEPRERLSRILAAVDPALVIAFRSSIGEEEPTAPFLFLDEEPEALATESRSDPQLTVSFDSLAYVLHTSGSSGRPKGVMVTHGGLSNYLGWCVEAYDVAAGGGAVVHSPIGFDLTVTSLLSPLLCGGRVLLLPEEAGIEALATALARAEVALFKLTPSHLDALVELLRGTEIVDRPRLLVVGGEALPGRSLTAWWQRDPGSRVVNEYGPTEAVVGCCVAFLTPDTAASDPVPIGRPIAGTRTWVLDPHLGPVPAGVRGELILGGPGLARGYLGSPGSTAARFIPDPFSGQVGGRQYRTGDLVRRRLDGELEFVGRLDAQLKIRGFRVEPAEIELALTRHPAVSEAVILTRSKAEKGTALLACFVPAEDDPPPDRELRAFLLGQVPDYMIPTAFVPVPAVPLTVNGKIDREALRGLAVARPAPQVAYVAPASELERTLAAIWTDVLRVERVGLYDNFFDLGGHSLLMVQVFSRIKARLETELLMVELFEFPTISAMAKRLAEERQQVPEPQLELGRAEARLETLRDGGRTEAAAARIQHRRSRENA